MSSGATPSVTTVFVIVFLGVGFAALVALPWLHQGPMAEFLRTGALLGGFARDGYVELARNLAAGQGFVFEPGGAAVFHRPPLYPALLAPLMRFPEPAHHALVTGFDVALLAGTSAVLFQLARRWFGSRAGLAAVVLTVANPWVLSKIGAGMPPIAQMFLFVSLVAVILRTPGIQPGSSGDRVSAARGIAIGLLGGALVLIHGTMLATVALALGGLLLWLAWRRAWAVARTLVLAGAVMVACVAPWTLRNLSVTGHLVPVAGNAGFAYFVGKLHWQDVDSSFRETLPERPVFGEGAAIDTLRLLGVEGPPEAHTHFYGLKDPDLDAELDRRMVEDVLADPLGFFGRVGRNAIEYFAPIAWPILVPGDASVTESVLRWKNKLARSVVMVGLLMLALASPIRAQPDDRSRCALLLLSAIAFASPYFLFYASRSDYSIGIIPILSLLAVVALTPPTSLSAGGPRSERSAPANRPAGADR